VNAQKIVTNKSFLPLAVIVTVTFVYLYIIWSLHIKGSMLLKWLAICAMHFTCSIINRNVIDQIVSMTGFLHLPWSMGLEHATCFVRLGA